MSLYYFSIIKPANVSLSHNLRTHKMFILFSLLVILSQSNLVSPQAPKNIFILGGQSNMSGRGGVLANNTWDGVVPPECQPSPSILRLSRELQWVEAIEPIHKDIDQFASCGIGPGMPFANTVLAKDPSIAPLGLVPCAIGNTKISQWQRGDDLYEQTLVKRAKAVVQTGGTIRAVLWFQGESDTVDENDANMYKARFEKFVTDLRQDLQSPELLIIQVGLASGQGPFKDKVREAQMAVNLPNVKFVDGKGLQVGGDFVHLTYSAEIQLGKMLASAFP